MARIIPVGVITHLRRRPGALARWATIGLVFTALIASTLAGAPPATACGDVCTSLSDADRTLDQPCAYCETRLDASTESSIPGALAEPCSYCDEGPGSAIEAIVDSDGDGLTDSDEVRYAADPTNPDTDFDGLLDGKEIHVHGTFPWAADSDNDGINDASELFETFTSPNRPDSDGDRLGDYHEVFVSLTDPLSADTDGDGYSDSDEVNAYYTDPNDPSDPGA